MTFNLRLRFSAESKRKATTSALCLILILYVCLCGIAPGCRCAIVPVSRDGRRWVGIEVARFEFIIPVR